MAGGGKEAVALAARMPFDLILLDLHMPGMDGRAALRAIREGDGPNGGVPVLAFTAESDGPELLSLRREGFDGVITKPILPALLVRQLGDVLCGAAEPAGATPMPKVALHA